MKTFTTLGLIATIAAAAATANAGESSAYARTATVYVADLDLSKTADAHVLYERITYAAWAVCTEDEPLAFEGRRQWRECVTTAVADAVASADAPLLTAVHSERGAFVASL
jgi:UrcA family protein